MHLHEIRAATGDHREMMLEISALPLANAKGEVHAAVIVQRRIALEREAYPSLVDEHVVFAERMVDTAPYVAHGEYVDGILTRRKHGVVKNADGLFVAENK